MVYLTSIDLAQNQLMNAIIQPLATAPSNPKLGQIYCDSTSNKIMWYNGTNWAVVGVVVESSATNGNIVVDGVEMQVYRLPKASESVLGGIKVGSGLTIDENGVLSALNDGEVNWSDINGTPTTVSGYGITDAVVKEAGKGLSTNDYTTSEKTKLSGVEDNANNYTHPDTHDLSMITDDSVDNVLTGDSKINRLLYYKNNEVTNISNVYKTGFYGTKKTDTSTPYASYWFVAVFCKDETNQIAVQWAMDVAKAHNGELWMRTIRLNAASTGDGNMIGAWTKFISADSPAFVGTPTAPTATDGTNSTQIATTEFVQTAVSSGGGATSKSIEITLLASSWDANGQYTFTDETITDKNVVELYPSLSITNNQLIDLVNAKILEVSQTAGSMLVKATGMTPTVDIPVQLVIRTDVK